jgi:uncharacterized protein
MSTDASHMRLFAFRLSPGQDLRQELLEFAKTRNLRAPVVLTCVGSLTDVVLRYANRSEPTVRQGHFEIVSLVGLVDPPRGHLHLSVADGDGHTTGGHLLDGCLVYTTAEIVLGELTDLEFHRAPDPATGFNELVIGMRE